MEIKLFLNKDINENANLYFEKAKKLKAKIPGIEKTLDKTKTEIEEFENIKQNYTQKKEKENKLKFHKKKEWFEKFRFTYTTSGFLCVLGKDASTNELLIKKYMQETDIVIHTQAAGSPFCLIKNARDTSQTKKVSEGLGIYDSLKISKEEINQAAQYTCCFSSQWKAGFGSADAFWVYPEQLSKKAQTGEYISKGGFMIYGEKNIIKNLVLRICLGVEKKTIQTEDEKIEFEELFSGTEEACKKYCQNRYIKIEPGRQTYKTLTKDIKKLLKITTIEDLPKYIPNECKILKK